MITKRPRRLDGVSYVGYQRYFLTICTAFRQPFFRSEATINDVLLQLRQTSALCGFEILAYCFMPDHLHGLVVASSEQAELTAFVKRFKQIAGYSYRQQHGVHLWQPGYHERILRDDEATTVVVRYILENPVRAGLTNQIGEYQWAGSDVYDTAALLGAWAGRQ